MFKKLSLIITVLLVTLSCVTTSTPLPRWAEIKPANTEKEIFFVYGPGETRARAKEGLYKEVSEYFGIKVSSFDKFVKVVEVENDNRDINQSTETQIDIKSREKGLNSIEILEIHHNKERGWWFLASLDSASEKAIKKQVEIDIENERVAGVLSQSEGYTKESQAKLDTIINNIIELTKIKTAMTQDIEKVEGIESQEEVMDLSKQSVQLGQDAIEIVKNTRALANEIKVLNKKNELLTNQLEGNDVALIELDLFIKESADILIKSEDKDIDITDLETDISVLKEDLDKIYLDAELAVLGETEAEKARVGALIKEVKDSYFKLKELSDSSKLMLSKSEDSLRNLKQSANSKSYTAKQVERELNTGIDELETSFNTVSGYYDEAMKLKTSIKKNFEVIKKSDHVTPEDMKEVNTILKRVDSPISWIEIYKDKVQIIINKAKKIKDNHRVSNGTGPKRKKNKKKA